MGRKEPPAARKRGLHRHHIIPLHAGGTDDSNNIEYLTAAGHAEAHRRLYEEHGRWQDRIAWLALSGHFGREEAIRARQIEANKSREWKDESKDKLRLVDKSYTQTAEYRQKMRIAKTGERNGFFGRKHTEETKAKLRAINSARNVSDETRRAMSAVHKKIKRERGANGRFASACL